MPPIHTMLPTTPITLSKTAVGTLSPPPLPTPIFTQDRVLYRVLGLGVVLFVLAVLFPRVDGLWIGAFILLGVGGYHSYSP